eukprot:363792-Prymnesium_polylepis.1
MARACTRREGVCGGPGVRSPRERSSCPRRCHDEEREGRATTANQRMVLPPASALRRDWPDSHGAVLCRR